MSPSTLFRSSGVALLLGRLLGLAWTAMSALILPITNPDQFASLPFLLTSLLMLFASMAIVAGLVGMYARQAMQASWLGFAGFVLIFFGMLVVGVGFGLISATVIPWLTTHAPNLLAGELPPVLNVFIIVAILMVVVGTIPLGVATMRAGILPRWAGLLLIVSGVAGLVVIAPLPALARNILTAASAVLFFLGLAWIGYALWSERERTMKEVQVPVPATSEVSDVATAEATDGASAETPEVTTAKAPKVASGEVSDGATAEAPEVAAAEVPEVATAEATDGATAEAPEVATAEATD